MSSNNPGYQPPYIASIASGAGGAGGGNHTLTLGAGGTGVHTGTIAISPGNTWDNMIASRSKSGEMHLNGPEADIVINGRSLNQTLDAISARLSILQPKPELLAKYESLQQAYDHYKTLEALLHDETKDE